MGHEETRQVVGTFDMEMCVDKARQQGQPGGIKGFGVSRNARGLARSGRDDFFTAENNHGIWNRTTGPAVDKGNADDCERTFCSVGLRRIDLFE